MVLAFLRWLQAFQITPLLQKYKKESETKFSKGSRKRFKGNEYLFSFCTLKKDKLAYTIFQFLKFIGVL